MAYGMMCVVWFTQILYFISIRISIFLLIYHIPYKIKVYNLYVVEFVYIELYKVFFHTF